MELLAGPGRCPLTKQLPGGAHTGSRYWKECPRAHGLFHLAMSTCGAPDIFQVLERLHSGNLTVTMLRLRSGPCVAGLS